MDDKELKEGHKLVVNKDIELKANWEDVKVNPVKKALNSLLGKDKDELDISNINVGDAVMAGENTTEGDPQGTVVSKDGKTRITMFEVNWVGTNERTVINDVDKYRKHPNNDSYQAEVKWAISGEREYEPGSVRINMTNKIFIGEKQKYNFYPDYMPIPKAVLKGDGFIDFNADYQKSDFVYVENDDNTISLVNIITLQPGNHGNYTITYQGEKWKPGKDKPDAYGFPSKVDTMYDFENGDIGDLKSFISVKLDNDEIVSKNGKYLHIKSIKTSDLKVKKVCQKYMSWPLDKKLAPENKDDYIYLVYAIFPEARGHFDFDINILDKIQSPQELVYYSKPKFDSLNGSNIDYYIYKSELERINFIAAENTKELNITFPKVRGLTGTGQNQNWYKSYVVTKVPKSIANNGDKHIFENSVTVSAKTLEKNSQKLTGNDAVKIEHQDRKFEGAPSQKFSHNKFSSYSLGAVKNLGALNKLLKGEPCVLGWMLEGKSNAMDLTYDPSFGAINNELAYGKKTFKQVLSDEYMFIDDGSNAPLTNEDFEIGR